MIASVDVGILIEVDENVLLFTFPLVKFISVSPEDVVLFVERFGTSVKLTDVLVVVGNVVDEVDKDVVVSVVNGVVVEGLKDVVEVVDRSGYFRELLNVVVVVKTVSLDSSTTVVKVVIDVIPVEDFSVFDGVVCCPSVLLKVVVVVIDLSDLGLNISCNLLFKLSIPLVPLYIGTNTCISLYE